VKRIDYYAVQNPWRVPKWVGAMLGGIFGVIVLGSMITIVQLTRPAVAAPLPTAAATPVAAPTTAPVALSADGVKASAQVASADDEAPAAPKKHASKKLHSKAKSKKQMRLAMATKHSSAPSLNASQRATILAKHDSKASRHDKDALDKLLGL
jgi:hypothetical protein